MANETDTGLMGQGTTAEALIAEAAKPFDPAALLTARPAPRPPLPGEEALPYAVGPTAEVLPTFDPAALLGDAARRGPAMIGDGKPLVARIGGVEVVTIPLEHYAGLIAPMAPLYEMTAHMRAAPAPNPDAMLEFLLSLHHERRVTDADLVKATGLNLGDLADRIAEWKAAQPQPWLVDTMDADGTMRGKTPEGVPFTISPALSPAEVAALDAAPPADPKPSIIAPTPEEATVDLARPAGMPEEATIPIPTEPLDTRATPPEPKRSTTFSSRRRDKSEHRGGPMDREGQPDNRETDPHDLAPRGRRDGLDRA